MKIERDVEKPVKTFHIKKLEKQNFGFVISVYRDNSLSNLNFNIVISKNQENDGVLSNPEDILMVLTSKDAKKIQLALNTVGTNLQIIQKNKDVLTENDTLVFLKEKIKDLNINYWENNRFLNVRQEQSYINRATTNNSINYSNEDKSLYAMKPLLMIEALAKLGYINILRIQPNGSDEEKYNFEFKDKASNGTTSFNISVVKRYALNGNKSNIFNDFYNQKKKGIGSSGLGLLNHLCNNGFLGGYTGNESQEERNEKSKRFFIDNILPHINTDSLVYNEESNTSVFLGKSTSFSPIDRKYSNVEKTFREFLKWRMIPEKTIDECFNKNLAFTGDYYVSRVQNEPEKDGSGFKPNYGYNYKGFIRLREWHNKYGNLLSSAEMFNIKYVGDKGEKPFEYNKINVGNVQGKYFLFGEEKKPKMAIIHESIIDALSSHTLLNEAGVDADSIKYISIQGTSHFQGFFKRNIGLSIDVKKEENRSGNTQRAESVYIQKKEKDMSDSLLAEYQEKLSDKKFIFIDYGDTPDFMLKQLDKLKSLFKEDSFEIIKKEKRENVDFKDYNPHGTILCDKENYKPTLEALKISFDFKTNDMKSFYEKESLFKLEEKSIKIIKSKIEKFFGTNKIAYCLDNDHAGLPYLIFFAELKRHFGVESSFMIPNDLSYGNFQGTTLKEFISNFEKLCDSGKYEEAYKSVYEYIDQKPEVDNNDILKHYYNLLKENKQQEAEAILIDKLKQLNINPDSDLLLKNSSKKTTTNKPKNSM